MSKSTSGLNNDLKLLHQLLSQNDDLQAKITNTKKRILHNIKQNEMMKNRFKLGDRYVQYGYSEPYKTLTQKYLSEALLKYYNDNSTKAGHLLKFLLDNRHKSKGIEYLKLSSINKVVSKNSTKIR